MGVRALLKLYSASQKGLSLVELMVGVVVGLFVILSATAIYLNATKASRDSIRANRLNQDVRTIMDVIAADIRRSGYWGKVEVGTAVSNPFTQRSGASTTDIFVSDSCVLYSYDLNKDGDLQTSEFFGFRRSNGRIQVPDQSSEKPLGSTSLDDCKDDLTVAWISLNDSNEVVVSALNFNLSGSQCFMFNEQTYDSGDPKTYRQWVSTNEVEPACATNPTGGTGELVSGGANERRVEMRQVQITLTAGHAKDSLLSRTITEVVLIPNNRVI